MKDGLLYIGSFGKEYTDNHGNIQHTNNLWTIVLNREGQVLHVNWSDYYNKMRDILGLGFPGYMIHEAVSWSPVRRQWFVLPRRMSKESYDDAADEKRGANTIITASSDFSKVEHSTVGVLTPERGFSSMKFLPGSHDGVMVALKSAENADLGQQTTFLTIYGDAGNGQWKVLMEETELPGGYKFEGLEIL